MLSTTCCPTRSPLNWRRRSLPRARCAHGRALYRRSASIPSIRLFSYPLVTFHQEGSRPMEDYFVFNAGNVVLQSGITFRDAKLAYQTYGKLNAEKSNVILYMTSFSAHHYDIEWMVGPGKALDTDKYFVVIPNLFGNGLSSSPSNATEPFSGSRWPSFTIAVNVAIQHQLLTQKLGIDVWQLASG